MKQFWTSDVVKLSSGIFVALAMAGLTAVAQAQNIGSLPDPTAPGVAPRMHSATVAPIGELQIYSKQPSSWFGNTFSEEIGTIEPNQKFIVKKFKEIGSFQGADVWVELAPDGDSATNKDICGDGCWAYLGSKDSTIAPVVAPPVVDGAVGLQGLGYGNFIFLEDGNS